jgi:hypothetical protein
MVLGFLVLVVTTVFAAVEYANRPPTAHPTTSTTITAAERKTLLLSVVDRRYVSCADYKEALFVKADLSFECQSDGIEALRLALFSDAFSMLNAYNKTVIQSGVTRDSGALNCDKNRPGEGEWATSSGELGGRYLCFVDAKGRAQLHWTNDEKEVYAYVYRNDANIKALVDWWEHNAVG